MFLIGSQALNKANLYPPARNSEIQDIDWLCSELDYIKFLEDNHDKIVCTKNTTVFMLGSFPVEFKIDPKLLQIVLDNKLYCENYVLPEVVLALKLSHRYVKNSPHFLKTLKDIHFLRYWGYKVPYCLNTWIKEEEKRLLSYPHPKLNRKKEEFFTDIYKYDHDSIHRAVATYDKPAYEYYKHPDKEVLCSKELFFSVHENIRLAGVMEEALVLALERHQIPNDFRPNLYNSFYIALEKVCTSITSGWFREYAYDNYFTVETLFDKIGCKYIDKFNQALKEGRVLPFAET